MNDRGDTQLLEALHKRLEDLDKLSAREHFQRMIDRGLIDEHGRLRRDPRDPIDETRPDAAAAGQDPR